MPENMDFDTKIIYIGVLEVKKSTIMHFHPRLGVFVTLGVDGTFSYPMSLI